MLGNLDFQMKSLIKVEHEQTFRMYHAVEILSMCGFESWTYTKLVNFMLVNKYCAPFSR